MQTFCPVRIFIKIQLLLKLRIFYNVNGYIQIVILCYLSSLYRGLGPLELSISTALPFYSRSSRRLLASADRRWHLGLLPRTCRSYDSIFRLFLALMIHFSVDSPWTEAAVLMYMEYLVSHGLAAVTLQNHIAVLSHYFAIFKWPLHVLPSTKVTLFVKLVKINMPKSVRVKGVFSVAMLRQLILVTEMFDDAVTFKALYLTAFSSFFRLATLVPSSVKFFDVTRFPIVQDLVWASPGLHMVVTCSKTMQQASEFQVVQIPSINDQKLYTVLALQAMISCLRLETHHPLFMVKQG